MGERNAQISMWVRQALRVEPEGIAARERKKPREIVELILEWSVARRGRPGRSTGCCNA